MPRYKLTIEYDGTPFAGWQRQANGHSVQAAIEDAIAAFSGARVTIGGAGRTDAGVHALAQVAHVDLAKDWPADTVLNALNFHLQPEPVAVLAAECVADDFDARFSAKARHYRYRIINRRPPLTIDASRAWQVKAPLDGGAMDAAAQRLIGTHDFTTFRNAACQAKSPVKTLDRLSVQRQNDEIVIEACARSFRHSQVRSIAGSLRLVGDGRWSDDDLSGALAAKDRKACGPVAPAEGLYLLRVDY